MGILKLTLSSLILDAHCFCSSTCSLVSSRPVTLVWLTNVLSQLVVGELKFESTFLLLFICFGCQDCFLRVLYRCSSMSSLNTCSRAKINKNVVTLRCSWLGIWDTKLANPDVIFFNSCSLIDGFLEFNFLLVPLLLLLQLSLRFLLSFIFVLNFSFTYNCLKHLPYSCEIWVDTLFTSWTLMRLRLLTWGFSTFTTAY